MNDPGGKPLVLIVDDEYGPRESIAFSLSSDFAVEAVDRAKHALVRVGQNAFDAILLDIRMPEMDGIRALEEIRKIDPLVGVIILTGYGTLQTAQQAMVYGANQYLRKPPDVFELQQAVRKQVLDTRQRRAHAAAIVAAQELGARLKQELDESRPKIWQAKAAAELVHDLVNPLTVVVGYSSLLASQLASRGASQSISLGERAADYLDTISQAAEYCRYLAENWRRMTNVSATFERVDLSALAKGTVKVVFGDSSAIHVDADGEAYVNASKYEVMRVLQNIIKNGIEAGACTIRVLVRDVQERGVELVICDDGPGMNAEQKASALEGGRSTKEYGSGLGLGICRHIVSAHGGSFDLSSTPGTGTTVRILFPSVRRYAATEG